jgi:bacterioferritin
MPTDQTLDEKAVIGVLNEILELELAGVVRYTHYSLMIFGYNRIPIVAWMREQANEAITHASLAGEHITTLGGHPSLKIGQLLESHKHDIGQIMHEALAHERGGIAAYRRLHELVAGRSIVLEEYARTMIHDEEIHASEIEKMLRRPGHMEPAE